MQQTLGDETLWSFVEPVIIDAIQKVSAYRAAGNNVPPFSSYPVLRTKADGSRFVSHDGKGGKNYAASFGSQDSKAEASPLRYDGLRGMSSLVSYVSSVREYRDKMIRSTFAREDLITKSITWEVEAFVGAVVQAHNQGVDNDTIYDRDTALRAYKELERWWRRDDLRADLWIPICGITFSQERIKLAESSGLHRVSDAERLAMWPGYTLTDEQQRLLSAFTHALVLPNVKIEQDLNTAPPTYSGDFPVGPIERLLQVLAVATTKEFGVAY